MDCKAAPGPGFLNAPGFEIVDVPEQKTIFILDIAGAHSWRAIYMDGRGIPSQRISGPLNLGHSIGNWEGDMLVVDSVGFNEKQWAAGAFPNTSQLHMIERISRPNLGTLTYQVTIDDPGRTPSLGPEAGPFPKRPDRSGFRAARCSNIFAKTLGDKHGDTSGTQAPFHNYQRSKRYPSAGW